MKREESIGKTFGKLTVAEVVGSNRHGSAIVAAVCTCGIVNNYLLQNLVRSNTTQCKSCSIKSRVTKTTKYDMKNNEPTYSSWNHMIQRCKVGGSYYSLGRTVCERWCDPDVGFLNFLSDMGDRPEGCTIDRIDNTKGYFPENCRWATPSVQNRNKGKVAKKTHSKYVGVSLSHGIWCIIFTKPDGVKIRERYDEELDAAIRFDNLTEDYFNFRPNNTERSQPIIHQVKRGGITFCSKSKKYLVRVTDKGVRKRLGLFETHALAFEFLESYLELRHSSN